MTCATDLHDDVILPMSCSHVQKRVSAHVSDVGSGPSHEKHFHNVPVAVHASIVERGKAMLITVCVCVCVRRERGEVEKREGQKVVCLCQQLVLWQSCQSLPYLCLLYSVMALSYSAILYFIARGELLG